MIVCPLPSGLVTSEEKCKFLPSIQPFKRHLYDDANEESFSNFDQSSIIISGKRTICDKHEDSTNYNLQVSVIKLKLYT